MPRWDTEPSPASATRTLRAMLPAPWWTSDRPDLVRGYYAAAAEPRRHRAPAASPAGTPRASDPGERRREARAGQRRRRAEPQRDGRAGRDQALELARQHGQAVVAGHCEG